MAGKVKSWLLRFHIISGSLLLLNTIAAYFFDFHLLYIISQSLKLIFFGTGIVLFFMYKRPFQKWKLYFTLYILPPFVALFSLFFGLAGLFVVYMMALALFPKTPVNESDSLLLYRKFSSPMKVPDQYEVAERYFLFEKKLCDIKVSEDYHEFEDGQMSVFENTFTMKYRTSIYEYGKDDILKDTIFTATIN